MFTLQQLLSAGLPAVSTDGNDAKAITEFSRTLTPAEWITYLGIADPNQARQIAARTTAKNIPNWALWTQQDWLNYFGSNLSDTEIDAQVNTITTLATAKVVIAIMFKRQNKILDALAKLEIALRDQIWPDLPG